MKRLLSSQETHRKAVDASYLYLTHTCQVTEIKNVESLPAFQASKVHLVCKTRDLLFLKIKVIGDNYAPYTGNFFFETENLKKKCQGSFYSTQADWIFYYLLANDTLYILPAEDTRCWLDRNRKKYHFRQIRTKESTKGFLVPIDQILKEVKKAREIRL